MTTRADVEQVAAQAALRSRLVEMVLHGNHQWFVAFGDIRQPISADAAVDAAGDLVLVFFIQSAAESSASYDIWADNQFMQSVIGPIVKGKPCRLRMFFKREDRSPASA